MDRFIGLFVHVVNHTAHARSVRLSSDDIDDLCAEVFLTLLADDFAVLRRFRGRCSLATYLAVIARRVVVREIARRRKAEALGHVPAHKASLDRAGSGPAHERRIDDEDEIQFIDPPSKSKSRSPPRVSTPPPAAHAVTKWLFCPVVWISVLRVCLCME